MERKSELVKKYNHCASAACLFLIRDQSVIGPILEDLRALGVDAVWPQLPLYDHHSLARRCRELGLAVQLHPDRGDLLQRATPQQVRSYILRLIEQFDSLSGGSWLYLEVDPGFPWENIKAMFEAARELRA